MNQSDEKKGAARRFKPAGIIFALLGLALFAYVVNRVGTSVIVTNIRSLGAGFLLVLAFSGVRLIVRALAWTRCFEAPHQLRFRDALTARIMGDALGNLVPFGTMIIGEPAKAVLVRKRVPLLASLSALAIENIFYSLSVALFIFSGTIALLLNFPLPKALRYACFSALGAVAVIIPLAYLVIHRQWKFLSRAVEFLYGRGIGRRLLETRRESVRSLESRVYGFYGRNRARFLPIMLLECCFHLAGAMEAYVVLWFISMDHAPTLLMAFILESVNRMITVVFKFMPLRVGIGESASEQFAKILGFTLGKGATLEIIRKIRDLCWTTLGFALLLRRGLSLRAVAEETQTAVAREVTATRRDALPASE
ncbi:MAG TPA: lysylphosphatidylglycerol synthase transmembrane domain-containing protein [Pyrinomonadaceae bacterium]